MAAPNGPPFFCFARGKVVAARASEAVKKKLRRGETAPPLRTWCIIRQNNVGRQGYGRASGGRQRRRVEFEDCGCAGVGDPQIACRIEGDSNRSGEGWVRGKLDIRDQIRDYNRAAHRELRRRIFEHRIAEEIANPEVALDIEHCMRGSDEAFEADGHVRALSRLRGELRRGEFLQ
jgi:hypothetical protein